ncbi:MAG: aminoacyl-tRNA hydrolase [Synergistetes bacterium]|nr:aminoacyl-tRNA hydrolase [Synergistota bacterium]
MKIIVGLGNPGEEYALTRHNIGFMVVDSLFEGLRFKGWKLKRDLMVASREIRGQEVYLCKPYTYMNNSGIAVLYMKEWLNVSAADFVIVYDDVDLPVGMIRVRKKGSAGGHKGMESIIYHLQTEEIPRVRIGIGPKPENVEMREYVLSNFSIDEIPLIRDALSKGVDALKEIIYRNIDVAMQKFNRKVVA